MNLFSIDLCVSRDRDLASALKPAQKRTFARRGVQQRPCDIRLLYDMYQQVRDQRQQAVQTASD